MSPHRFYAVLWTAVALIWGCTESKAAAPELTCVPLFENATHKGTWWTYGDGPQCRWIQWHCIPKDTATHELKTITVSARRDSVSFNTLLGRARELDEAKGDARRIKMELMFKAYVTGDPDPVCKAEYAPVAQ